MPTQSNEFHFQCKSVRANVIPNVFEILYGDFDTFDHYKVDEYLSSVGIVVSEKYRGRGIGEQFLRARKPFCETFGIKLTIDIFTSNFSNANADKVGFHLEKCIR